MIKNKSIPLIGLGMMLTFFALGFLSNDVLKSGLFTSIAIFSGLITFKLITKNERSTKI